MASTESQVWSLMASGCCVKETPAFSSKPARHAQTGLESERIPIDEPYHE